MNTVQFVTEIKYHRMQNCSPEQMLEFNVSANHRYLELYIFFILYFQCHLCDEGVFMVRVRKVHDLDLD